MNDIERTVRNMDGLKQNELENCVMCDRGVMHDGSITFYRMTIQMFVVDIQAVQRQHGMELMMGQAAPLAQIMGPNEDIAKAPAPPDTVLICQTCALDRSSIGHILSVIQDRAERAEEKGSGG